MSASITAFSLCALFGLSGNLPFFFSFLHDRSFSVVCGSTRTPWVPAPFGLPQGSVLGSLLYIIYTADLGPLLAACSVLCQSYADDLQAYLHCPASAAITAVVRSMRRAMEALETCMSSNRLWLNSSKPSLFFLYTRQK